MTEKGPKTSACRPRIGTEWPNLRADRRTLHPTHSSHSRDHAFIGGAVGSLACSAPSSSHPTPCAVWAPRGIGERVELALLDAVCPRSQAAIEATAAGTAVSRPRRCAAGAGELRVKCPGLVFAGFEGVTTKRGWAPSAPRPGIHSALATTRRRRLQLSWVVQRQSAKRRAGSPVCSAACSANRPPAGRAIRPWNGRGHDAPGGQSSIAEGGKVRKTLPGRPRRGERAADVVDQALVAGEAEEVVGPVFFAPLHERIPCQAAVGTQDDAHARPAFANLPDDPCHVLGRTGALQSLLALSLSGIGSLRCCSAMHRWSSGAARPPKDAGRRSRRAANSSGRRRRRGRSGLRDARAADRRSRPGRARFPSAACRARRETTRPAAARSRVARPRSAARAFSDHSKSYPAASK